MKNRENIFFSFKLLFGFPIAGLIWTFLIYFFLDAESPNFKITYWIGGIGVALGTMCILSKHAHTLIFKLWNLLIHLIDTCITWITLPLFYYFIFSPFAIVLRIFGRASLNKKTAKPTFWKNTSKTTSLKQYFRQF